MVVFFSGPPSIRVLLVYIHTSKMNCTRETLTANPGITCVAMSGLADGMHSTTQQAVALYVAVDRSGSMADGNKLRNVLLSLDQMLTYLTAQDFLTVLAFDDSVSTTVDCEACDADNRVIIQQRLATLQPGNSTNLGLAIQSARGAMDRPVLSGLKKAFLLLTDGEATAGEVRSEKLLEMQQVLQAAHPDAELSAIGYGDDHNANLLRTLATSGTYSIVRSVEDVAAVFGDILGGLRTTTAQSVKLVVPSHVLQKTTLKTSVRASGLKEILVGNIIAGGKQMVVLEGLTTSDMVRLEYVRTADGACIIQENVVVSEPTREGQDAGSMALIRCQVVEILEQAQLHLASRAAAPDAGLLGQILTLQATLRAIPPDNVQAMLLRELDRAHTYLTMPRLPPALGRHYSNMLSQHTQVLGTARGIMSVEDDDDDPGRNVSVFASSVQRAISSGMSEGARAASSAIDSNPHGMHVTPAVSRAPTLSPSNSSSFPPPPPPGPLHRS